MDTDLTKPKPMNEDQPEYIKKEIIKAYFSLISHATRDPKVMEIMKLSALTDVERRYEAGEHWYVADWFRCHSGTIIFLRIFSIC